MSVNFFNILDEVHGDTPRFQRSNAIATVEQRPQPSKAPEAVQISPVPEKAKQCAPVKDGKYWEEWLAKVPPRVTKTYGTNTKSLAKTPRGIIKAHKAKGKARSSVSKKKLGSTMPMHGRPGVTIGQHLAEYEERNQDGYTFDEVVHLLLFGERAL